MMGSAAIGEVLSSWTGTITVASIAVTPRARESVVSLLSRLVQDVYVGTGITLTVTMSSTGVVTITGSSAFTLTASSNTATRTGFTGSYIGVTTATAATAFTGAFVPTHGLALELPGLYDTEGAAVADGTLAWTGPEQSARATLSLWTTYSDAWTAELLRGEYDVWGSDRMLGRVFVERFSRVPPSRLLRTGMMEVRGQGASTYVAEGLPFEIPQEWPVAQGWLYSWVDTSVAGYRIINVDGSQETGASDYRRFDEYITDIIEPAIQTASGACTFTVQTDGRLLLSTPVVDVIWPDRCGWLCGFGVEAGVTDTVASASASSLSRFVPPGGIPCLGVSWSEVEVQSEAEAIFDRHRRRHGFVFGAARIWRVKLTMTRWALQSLLTGWCLRGKVTAVSGSNTTAIAPGEPGGAIEGYVLGLDRVSWLDPVHHRRAVVELLVTTEGA